MLAVSLPAKVWSMVIVTMDLTGHSMWIPSADAPTRPVMVCCRVGYGGPTRLPRLCAGPVPCFDKDDAARTGSIQVEAGRCRKLGEPDCHLCWQDGVVLHKLPSGTVQRWKASWKECLFLFVGFFVAAGLSDPRDDVQSIWRGPPVLTYVLERLTLPCSSTQHVHEAARVQPGKTLGKELSNRVGQVAEEHVQRALVS